MIALLSFGYRLQCSHDCSNNPGNIQSNSGVFDDKMQSSAGFISARNLVMHARNTLHSSGSDDGSE